MFSLKSPQSHGTPHSAEPHIGPEITTPRPNSRPRSEPVQMSLHPISERRAYQTTEPMKSTLKARNEDHANGTCQNRMRYASGAFQASGSTDGAQSRPSSSVAAAPDRPKAVSVAPVALSECMARRHCYSSSMLVFTRLAGRLRRPRLGWISGSPLCRRPAGRQCPVRMTFRPS